jgi:FkbM family methyltransferase
MKLPRLGLGLRAAARRQLRSLQGRRTMTIAEGAAGGLKFRGARAGLSFADGLYELPVQRALGEALRPGDVFIDIGANVGFFTILGASLVGPSGSVYAFEPLAENAEAVRRNAALNGFDHVVVREEAISDASGEARIYLTEHEGGATLCSTGIVPTDVEGETVVERRALDQLIAWGELRPPNVIKLDVEGAELEALRGMNETLIRHRPQILYEVDDGDRQVLERRHADVREFLSGLGYHIVPLESSYVDVAWHVVHGLASAGEPATTA